MPSHNISSSGEITSSFENISNVFTSYTEIPSAGFNCLYKAQRYGKWFVLKGLKPEYQGEAVYEELLAKEFELGMKMEHPHIAHTFNKEVDPVAGPCIVMEYVDGMTLREFLAQKPPAKTRLKIVKELLEAMAYYHSLQIIHRDLKPDNILITRNGHNVKLIDFGLADSDYHGILKQPAGSNRYAAPEQVAGDVPLDLRADLYAFGIILAQIFPHRYRGIARKCTRLAREKRFNNAEEILRRLQRRRTLIVIFAVMALLLVIASMGVLLSHQQKTPVTEQPATAAIPVAHDSVTPIVVHDTILISETDIINQALQFIDVKMDSVFKPLQTWYNSVTAEESKLDSARVYDILIEFNHRLPAYNRKVNLRIVDETLKAYPQCSTSRRQLEQYAETCFATHIADCSNTMLELWEEKKKIRND